MFRVVFETEIFVNSDSEDQAKIEAEIQLRNNEGAYRSARKISDIEEWYRG